MHYLLRILFQFNHDFGGEVVVGVHISWVAVVSDADVVHISMEDYYLAACVFKEVDCIGQEHLVFFTEVC